MSAGGPEGSGRALRLDPFTLPVQFSAQDSGADGETRQVELGRDRVIVRRAVRGIPMKVGVPVTAFRGVTLTLALAGPGPGVASKVMLDHADSALSVPLFIADSGDDAIALWKSWGRVLGLPLLVVEGDGTVRAPYPRIGSVEVGTPAARRRRRAAIKWRRPSILLRRKPGMRLAEPLIHRGEREIIARN